MGRLRSGAWRWLAYIPRFARHYWHRRGRGVRSALSGARQRMGDYSGDPSAQFNARFRAEEDFRAEEELIRARHEFR
jgi:hypothetical protein